MANDEDRADSKRPFGFVKTMLLGAFLVVVPVGIVGFALWQGFKLAKALLKPVFDLLPFESSVTRILVIVAAVLSIVLLCYFTGLAVRTRWGRRLREWIERRFLEKIPGYTMLRSLAHQYLGHDEEQKFRPILVDLYGSGTRQIAFEIEETDEETVAVFIPAAPAVTVGQVYVVPKSRVFPVDATMHAAIESLTTFGVGSAKIVERKTIT
ncbi:MAG: DUF502 domain-containing protein [Verrucomicrobiota bacterium]